MPAGTVTWFSDEKGDGFSAPDDGGKDVFVHHSAIAEQRLQVAQEGTKVEYEVEEGSRAHARATCGPSEPGPGRS